MPLSIKARTRRAAETLLRTQATPIRRLLLATGRDRAPRLPEIVQIESTNICNAKCVFCPRDDMHRRQGVMSIELFQKVVDECAGLGITHVRMHNYGEAFMDRHLVEKIRYAKQKGIREVGVISNGSLITDTVARGIIDAGLDAINISVDASWHDPALDGAAIGWARSTWDALAPYATGGVYLNFAGLGDDADLQATALGSNQSRLAEILRAYDPDGLFNAAAHRP